MHECNSTRYLVGLRLHEYARDEKTKRDDRSRVQKVVNAGTAARQAGGCGRGPASDDRPGTLDRSSAFDGRSVLPMKRERIDGGIPRPNGNTA